MSVQDADGGQVTDNRPAPTVGGGPPPGPVPPSPSGQAAQSPSGQAAQTPSGQPTPAASRHAGAVVGAGAVTVGGAALVLYAADQRATRGTALGPERSTLLDPDPDLHLIRRASFGLSTALVAEVAGMGVGRWLDEQLHPDRIEDPQAEAILAAYPALAASAAQLRDEYASSRRVPGEELAAATIGRQIWSRRQLLEVMTDFWSNHFSVTAPGGPAYATKPVEDATVIRRHALDTFENLLLADATSPAMLLHLDNATSRGDDPNENYGRELLELHTVGIEAGYTEAHVRDSAYALTGWGVGPDQTFLFTPEAHYTGQLQILSWSAANADPAGGFKVGVDYLRYLAHHPATARHLSVKLARRFVADEPSVDLVEALAESYLDADTAIDPWLRTLFGSREFTASVGQKVRRPLEDLVASVRALGIAAPVTDPRAPLTDLVRRARGLGQAPLGAAAPTGYVDVAAPWLSSSVTLGRWNEHRALSAERVPGLDFPDVSTLTDGSEPRTIGEFIDALTTRLTGQRFRDDHRQALVEFLGSAESSPYVVGQTAAAVPDLIALILDSPYHLLR
ncbi:MAG: DUF1800 domain-containing protein [Geodermatophilaceae bacterium]|nr:DUF1800 domain-containing protein [Geodermatophilaceae bacterium]